MKIRSFLLAAMLCTLCIPQASALEYKMDAPKDYLFAVPTTQEEPIRTWENPNTDRSKNTALIPPGFGSAASYLPNSGEALAPNLLPGAGGLVTETGGVNRPSISGAIPNPVSQTTTTQSGQTTAYTGVTNNLYYSGGHLGTLKIPAIGLTVKVYQGTDSAALAKGAGHFTNTSIWNGNICVAGHNRGVNKHFGKIHTLKTGAAITLTTRLGTRTYAVTSVEKVSVNDSSGTAATTDNRVTLYTCVMNQPEYRWKVTAVEQA